MALADVVANALGTAGRVASSFLVTITYEAPTQATQYGSQRFSAAQSVTVLMEPTTRIVRGPDGREVVASHKLTALNATQFDVRGRVTLPNGSQPRLLSVQGLSRSDATSLYSVLYCG